MEQLQNSQEMREALEQEHKPMPVHGYTTQSARNLELVNKNKLVEEQVLCILDDLAKEPGIDGRWLAIGRTHLEQAFMAINRSIFKPQRFMK